MIVPGVTEVIGVFQMKRWGKILIWALLGVLYIVAGLLIPRSKAQPLAR